MSRTRARSGRRPGPSTVILLAAATLVTVAAGFSAQGPDAVVVTEGLGQELDRYLTRLEESGYAGAVAVSRDDSVVLCRGYGFADREAGRRVTPGTVFTCGSITKQFTGAAILKLEMQGKLSVEDPLTEFFSAVPLDKRGITLHHLLTHTAGFPEVIGDDFDTTATGDRFLAQALACRLLFPPGARHEYSNVGYSLLGIVVELVSDTGYERYLRENLLLPAGMTRTGYLLPGFADDELAVGYRGGERWGTILERPMLPDGPGWHLRANGGIHTTVGDLLRWHRALAGELILSREAKQKYFAPHVDEGFGDSWYGYGWVTFRTVRGTRLLAHNGGNGIFSADFRRYVDEGIVITVTTNVAEFCPADRVSEALAGLCFGR